MYETNQFTYNRIQVSKQLQVLMMIRMMLMLLIYVRML